MFIDKVSIKIKAGNGGNGCVSFYRAKYVPAGGPDGGDGGKGGDIVFEADTGVNTLLDFRYRRTFKCQPGDDGKNNNRTGKNGEDIIIKVPVGTIIRESESNKVMADMVTPGERRVLLKGGRGGRGNQHFATPSRQAPDYAEKGKLGKEYEVILELKLIADVSIIGFPNAGKSTLLSMVTNANPKIADYHFTTLSPNLGVVRNKWGRDFVLADIPGLIEGASEGIGLGHEFLRHIERTKVMIHVVDASGLEGSDPVDVVRMIDSELDAYDAELLKRPQVIAANKMDIPEAAENYPRIKETFPERTVLPVSAALNDGLDELIKTVTGILENYPEDIVFQEDFDEFIEPEIDAYPFNIEKTDDCYEISGFGIDKLMANTKLDSEKGFAFFQKYMRDKGIIAKLEEMGIKDGDTVKVADLEFDYYK